MCDHPEHRALSETQEERDPITGRNEHQQECVYKYRERIRDAIASTPPANMWNKAAARIRYIYQDAFGQGHLDGFASLTDEERAQWRVIAYEIVDWIAECLGDTVLEAKAENFQDDERVLLDIGPLSTEQKQDDAGQWHPQAGRLRHKLIMGNDFIKALAEAGIIGNVQCTESVTVFAKAWEDIVITQKMFGDERLLDQVGNAPSDEEIQEYLDKNPKALNGALKVYLRIHNLTGVRHDPR